MTTAKPLGMSFNYRDANQQKIKDAKIDNGNSFEKNIKSTLKKSEGSVKETVEKGAEKAKSFLKTKKGMATAAATVVGGGALIAYLVGNQEKPAEAETV